MSTMQVVLWADLPLAVELTSGSILAWLRAPAVWMEGLALALCGAPGSAPVAPLSAVVDGQRGCYHLFLDGDPRSPDRSLWQGLACGPAQAVILHVRARAQAWLFVDSAP